VAEVLAFIVRYGFTSTPVVIKIVKFHRYLIISIGTNRITGTKICVRFLAALIILMLEKGKTVQVIIGG